jgi:hypothetical protein
MTGSSAGSLRWVIGLPVFIAFTCCLFLNAASQLLENSDARLAAALNPLNTDARLNALVAELNGTSTSLDRLATEGASLVALSSADARGYSVVGAIEERLGDPAAAAASYTAALDHSRTERFALTRMLSFSLAAGDAATATRYFDLLLRRWYRFTAEIAPLAHDLVATPQGAIALKASLDENPNWRAGVVRELMTGMPGVRFMADLIATSSKRDADWRDDLATTIRGFMALGAPSEAYALFQQTLAPDETALAGYVFDPGLTRAGLGRAFDWSEVVTATVDASLPASPETPGLRIRFLDSPAKLGRPSQTLYLPAGNYTLSATADGTALAVPKGLYWQVRCVKPDGAIGRLDLGEGTYTARTFTAPFTVPANCPLQRLSLETGVTTSSWRDRYGGEILITDVHVGRGGAGA